MAIDDNRQSRDAVLASVRAALHRDGPDDVPRAAALAWAAVGVCNGMVNTDVSTLRLSRTPDEARGRVLARSQVLP